MRLFATVFVALMLAAGCHAAPKTVAAVRAAQPPQLDGALSDPCWTEAPTMGDFVLLGQDAAAKEQTTFKVAYDDTALYLGIVCKESQMNKLVATQTKHGSPVWNDDCVEIFLDPNHDHFNYFHFAFNPLGGQFDESGDGAGVAADWNAVWSVKTSRGADSWTAEVAIPFAILGVSSKVHETWGLNICREEKPLGELSCWQQTGAKFAAPSSFGEVTGLNVNFAPYLVTLGVQNWGLAILGGNTAEVKVTNDGQVERNINLRFTVTPPNEAPRATDVAVGKIAPKSSATARLGYQLFEQGEHEVSVEALDAAAGDKAIAATGKRMSVAPLAEFSIFKSYYRDDVAVTYKINVQNKDLAKYRLVATVAAAQDNARAIATQRFAKLAGTAGEIRFNTAKLALGEYRVHAEVLDAADKAVAVKDLDFAVLGKAVAKRLVDIDSANFIRVNGKRTFPIGIYSSPASEKGMQNLADAGFTLVQSNALPPAAMKALLDKAQQHGLKVWVSVSAMLDFSKDAEKKRQDLAALVAAVGNHPALLMWESIDEPAWGSQNADGLYEGYKYLRALDPNRPIWTNHAPRNFISTLAYYNRATDIAGCDIYPVPEPQSQSNLPNRTIHVVGDEADKSVASVNGDKPIIMVLQGFGWAELSGHKGAANGAILPTLDESRFMAYDAILHGARGINYWGTAYTERPSKFYCELKSLASELQAMQPVLTADIIPAAKAGSVKSPENAVQMQRRIVNGKSFILAINTLKKEQKAEFSVPALTVKELSVLYEGRKVRVQGGKFIDRFAPYATHVYTEDASFNPQRKSFEDELKQVPTATVPVYQPGDLIANGSFEIDADDDMVPDGWSANYPFSVQLSEAQAHSGKRSLLFVSTAADFSPLAVQYGIPNLKPDGSYMLLAWVKTDRPGLEFRIYAEWAGWHGAVLPWTKGTGEWQYVEIPFKSEPSAVGTIYSVLQIKGEGRAWFDDVKLKER